MTEHEMFDRLLAIRAELVEIHDRLESLRDEREKANERWDALKAEAHNIFKALDMVNLA